MTAASRHEFHFTDAHFELLRALAARRAGILLNDSKRQLVYGRVARRIRALQLPGFDAYCALVRRDDGVEIENFINAMTTNLTSFFRENHHFELLARTVMPQLLRAKAGTRRIRIWSAGCSTGEEAYSIAMSVRELVGATDRWDIGILATDIDSSVIATARAGVYAHTRLQAVAPPRRRRWFTTADCPAGYARATDELREGIRFAALNLLEPWPASRPFDVIFCRNVVIYFDKPTQAAVFDRFADVIAQDGYLFIGHSETLFGSSTRFDLIGPTTYRPRAGSAV